jgi:hypothetical protein
MSDQQAITFVQYLLPPLESGDFTVTATQAITTPDNQGETFQATQALFVKGARYTLDDGAVDSVFPPAGNQGDFANVLPHVVFDGPTLPWQRTPAGESVATSVDGDPPPPVPTWLGVLLFDELDPPPTPVARTIGDLAPSGSIFFPPRTAEYGEQASDPLTTIDVPLDLYAQIAPAVEDLQWTAHVREASVIAKPAADGAAPTPDFAVVFGTRLPQPSRVSTVHLVSLEGFGPYLPSGPEHELPVFPSGVDTVRMVTLRSWTFSTIAFNQTFAGMLEAVDRGPLQLPFTPGGGAAATVGEAFGMGYTALDHALRDGGSTVSWYRGPLLPLGVTAPPFAPAETPDQHLRYDPSTGMFDVSYAAAWELGRLLALHDRAYATALYRWKLRVAQDEALALEEEIIGAMLPPIDEGGTQLRRAVTQVLGPALAALAGGPGGADAPRPPRRRPDRETLGARLAAPRADVPADAERGTDEQQVIDWLTQLHLLAGVPFGYLVPDIGMLPNESIRFFKVDLGWVEALLDGAFAVGTTRSGSGATRGLRGGAVDAARARLPLARRALVGETGGALPGAPEALSGFLLRSGVVPGWPGLEVYGFADTAGTQPLDLVRLEPVAPSLLLGLFGGTLARVDFREPPEGIHFGIDVGTQQGTWQKQLRYADGSAVGTDIPGEVLAVEPSTAGVIGIDGLRTAMATKVWSEVQPPPPDHFTAAEFGLEMVEGVEAVSFQVGT